MALNKRELHSLHNSCTSTLINDITRFKLYGKKYINDERKKIKKQNKKKTKE